MEYLGILTRESELKASINELFLLRCLQTYSELFLLPLQMIRKFFRLYIGFHKVL